MRISLAALTFIILIIVVLMSDTLATAIFIISLLVNFFLIGVWSGFLSVNTVTIDVNAAANAGAKTSAPPAAPTEHLVPNQDVSIYGPSFDIWQSYNTGYTSAYASPEMAVATSCAEKSYDIDTMNALTAQKRARDKKCSDGWASKNSLYYKYYFGSELDDAEASRWWGQTEM